MANFKLKMIFEIEKDKPTKCSGLFRKYIIAKYNVSIEESNSLYRKITNYQIKKYGSNLTGCFLK